LISQKQSALHEEIAAIKTEISTLKQELLRDQDPERMQLVQSLIGVSPAAPMAILPLTTAFPSFFPPDHRRNARLSNSATHTSDQHHPGKGIRSRSHRQAHHVGYPAVGRCEAESDWSHYGSEEVEYDV
jgi:hypothetical protein